MRDKATRRIASESSVVYFLSGDRSMNGGDAVARQGPVGHLCRLRTSGAEHLVIGPGFPAWMFTRRDMKGD